MFKTQFDYVDTDSFARLVGHSHNIWQYPACSRLSVSRDNWKSGWETIGINGERVPFSLSYLSGHLIAFSIVPTDGEPETG